jgi:GNAT superfamily N-acetyltransferase
VTVSVRRAVAADAERLAEIHLAARLDAMPDIVIPHPPGDVVRYHRDEVIPAMETWVAAEAGVVRGYLAMSPGWVHHLYLDPADTGRGIGAQLLELAKERQPDGFELWVFQANDGARRFYERHGLRAVRFTDGRGNEERAPDLLERWRPSPSPSVAP